MMNNIENNKSEGAQSSSHHSKDKANINVLLLASQLLMVCADAQLAYASTDTKALQSSMSQVESCRKALSNCNYNILAMDSRQHYSWNIHGPGGYIAHTQKTAVHTALGATVQPGQTFTYWYYDGGWQPLSHCYVTRALKTTPVPSAVLQADNFANKSIDAHRSHILGQIVGLNMGAKVTTTDLNTSSDAGAQNLKSSLNFLDLLNSLDMKISQMHAGNK